MFQPMHLLIILIFLIPGMIAVFVIPLWVAFKKAGLSPAFSFLVVVPFGPIIVLYVLAFSKWKVMPAPEYGYPPAYPPPGYVPTAVYPPPPPVASYVPPPDTPSPSI
jgi:hypothetical protein